MKWPAKKINEGMYREEREGRLKKTKGAVYGLAIGFVICGIVWFFLYSGFFDARKIEIAPLQVLSEGAVRGEMDAYFNRPKQWPWGNNNIFFLNSEDLKSYLDTKFFISSITVDKSYPNILRLKISERQRSVVLVTKNNMYVVDDYGVISDVADDATVSTTRRFLINPSPVDSPKEVYVISSTTSTYSKGDEYVDLNRVRGWLDIANRLREAGVWFKALDIGLEPQSLLQVLIKENKYVLVDTDDLLDAQIETLRQFLATKPKMDQINEYIDVRVPGRIYFK
ncbi:MAG: hypothetical protein PHS79_02570 [Patescibacteria group bacterium]|nr:hypothetical protein [Patescibacteria group bacterium]